MEYKYSEFSVFRSDFIQVKQERVSKSCCYNMSSVWSIQLGSQRPNICRLRNITARSNTNWL